jgi:histidinol-phosphate aminotransferase
MSTLRASIDVYYFFLVTRSFYVLRLSEREEVTELPMKKTESKITPKPGILSIPIYVGGKSKSKGMRKPIKLSANENPYGPSPHAIKAFLSAKESLAVYPDSAHNILRKAIAEVMGIDSNKIICGAGSDEIIQLLCQCYAGQDDEVIHTEHGFAMYRISALAAGANPIEVAEINRHADISAIIRACNKKTKLIFLANPNNPTGTFIDNDQINSLANSIPEHTLLVLDGAYAEYIENFDAGVQLLRKKTMFLLHELSQKFMV